MADSIDPVRMFVEDLRRDREDQMLADIRVYRKILETIRNVVSSRLISAADDDDLTAVEAFVLGEITGILIQEPTEGANP